MYFSTGLQIEFSRVCIFILLVFSLIAFYTPNSKSHRGLRIRQVFPRRKLQERADHFFTMYLLSFCSRFRCLALVIQTECRCHSVAYMHSSLVPNYLEIARNSSFPSGVLCSHPSLHSSLCKQRPTTCPICSDCCSLPSAATPPHVYSPASCRPSNAAIILMQWVVRPFCRNFFFKWGCGVLQIIHAQPLPGYTPAVGVPLLQSMTVFSCFCHSGQSRVKYYGNMVPRGAVPKPG
jgi:hypothetical protein